MTAVLSQTSLWALVLTLICFRIATFINKRTGIAILNPIIVAAFMVVGILLLFKIPNAEYQAGMKTISWLLTPCTVCFGIPLYNQLNRLRGNLTAILIGILSGTAASILMVIASSFLLGFDRDIMISLLPKSVTTAIAISLTESSGGLVPLSVASVIVAGILGNVIGDWLIKLFRVKNKIAIGVGLGTASHIVGTTKATEIDELCGAVSSLSLVIAGLATAALYPLLLSIL